MLTVRGFYLELHLVAPYKIPRFHLSKNCVNVINPEINISQQWDSALASWLLASICSQVIHLVLKDLVLHKLNHHLSHLSQHNHLMHDITLIILWIFIK